jgi:NitT/TauT family transport system permease protein
MSTLLQETRGQRIVERQKQLRKDKILSIVLPLLTMFFLLALWEALVVLLKVPAWMVPKPSNVFKSMVLDFGLFWPHIFRSYYSIITGWVFACLLGVLLAALISNFKLLGYTLTPYINMLVTTPVITLVPLMLLFLGFTPWVIILAVIMQSFAIVIMNSATGFNNVAIIRLELMQSLRANRLMTFFRCVLPSSWPNVFTGMKLAGIFATTACVSSEFNGGSVGLGSQIIAHTQFMRTNKAFACIFYVAVIGIILYNFSGFLENKVVKWKE